jgi:hypothetical protein
MRIRLSALDRRRLQFFAVAAVGLLLFLVGVDLEARIGQRAVGPLQVGTVLWLVYIVAASAAAMRWYLYRCPSCGARMFRRPYSNECWRCRYVLPAA